MLMRQPGPKSMSRRATPSHAACRTAMRRAAAIHGDMDQHGRMSVLAAFRAGTHHVLVATDVAARGLDIKSIKSVVNYDAAKDIDTHVHRVGRTGRAGDREGVAHTLVTPREARFAGEPWLLPDDCACVRMVIPKALWRVACCWRNDRGARPASHRPVFSLPGWRFLLLACVFHRSELAAAASRSCLGPLPFSCASVVCLDWQRSCLFADAASCLLHLLFYRLWLLCLLFSAHRLPAVLHPTRMPEQAVRFPWHCRFCDMSCADADACRAQGIWLRA